MNGTAAKRSAEIPNAIGDQRLIIEAGMLLIDRKHTIPSAAEPSCFLVKNHASLCTDRAIAKEDDVTATMPAITKAITTAINRPSKDVHQANIARRRSFVVRLVPVAGPVIPLFSRVIPHHKSMIKRHKPA
jgi:hypothetical protein